MALPQLTNIDTKKKGDLVALIDDESVERITTKISDVFSKINLENTSSFVTKLSENLVNKFDTFKNMEMLLKDISGLITKSNELFSSQFKKEDDDKEKREFDDKEEKEDKEKKPKKPKEKKEEENRFKKLFSNFVDIAKMGLFDPEAIGKVIIGSLAASSIGTALTKIAGFMSSSKGFGLAGAGIAVGNEMLNSYNESAEYMTKTNNGEVSAMLGRFFGGSGKDSLMDKFNHYSKWAGMGAMFGLAVGPIGMFAGAILGGAVGFAADYLGANWFADKATIIGDKITSLFNIFDPKDYQIDTSKLKEEIEKSKSVIQQDMEQISKNEIELSNLQDQLLEARKSGNDGLVETIQKKISILEDATRRLKSDAESENEKVRTKSNELVTVATTGFTKKMLNWTKNNLALLNPSTFLIGVGMPEVFEKLKNDTYRGIIDGSTSVYNIIKDSILGLINGVSDWIKNHFNLSKILGFDKAEENKNAVDLGKTVGSLVQPPKNPITEATKQLNVDIITRKSKAITEKAKEANIGQHFPMPMVIPTGPNITNTDARSSTNIQNVHPSRPSSYDTNFSGYSKGE